MAIAIPSQSSAIVNHLREWVKITCVFLPGFSISRASIKNPLWAFGSRSTGHEQDFSYWYSSVGIHCQVTVQNWVLNVMPAECIFNAGQCNVNAICNHEIAIHRCQIFHKALWCRSAWLNFEVLLAHTMECREGTVDGNSLLQMLKQPGQTLLRRQENGCHVQSKVWPSSKNVQEVVPSSIQLVIMNRWQLFLPSGLDVSFVSQRGQVFLWGMTNMAAGGVWDFCCYRPCSWKQWKLQAEKLWRNIKNPDCFTFA